MTIDQTWAIVGELKDKAMAEYRAVQWGTSSLYFSRATATANGSAAVVSDESDAPEGFELAIPISRAWDHSRTEREIVRALRTAPIIAFGRTEVSR